VTSSPAGVITTTIPTATLTPTPTVIPEEPAPASTTISSSPSIYLPFIAIDLPPTPPPFTPIEKVLFCDSLSSSRTIPDNNINGINDWITIGDPRQIVDIDVMLNISHTWVGDLVVDLTHEDTGEAVKLLNRPGRPDSALGCGNNNIRAILDDEISSPAENKCASSPAAISGIYIPNQPLSWFDGLAMSGSWRINVSDRSASSTGSLNHWCIMASLSENPEPPAPTPPPDDFPSSRIISGVRGAPQSLPLDCESRSAVDWAQYFGVSIGELEFYNLLPHSDNPDKGFVGSVYGQWGQIPPNPYGVHAEPVAEVLRDFGLPAYAHRPLSWDELRAEVGNGRPVIVWIIDSISNGIPVYYTPSDGLHTIVARYEHTVIVTGYTSSLVYYLNGGTIYTVSVGQFLDSWSALDNMAITTRP
jgi:subtilisin-like proprotein convertase family protein/uncharacterized protein YvpB